MWILSLWCNGEKKKLILITKEINNMSYKFYECDELSQIMAKIDTSM